MEALGNFISFFNIPASYVSEHYSDRCIVEYRIAHDELHRRSISLKSLSLDESVLEKIIDGTIDENFDSHDVELIEAYNAIEEFCGDKNWGYSYKELRNLIQSAKRMDSEKIFERQLRPRMYNKDAVEIKLGMKEFPKLQSIDVCGCEKILVVNCVDLYDMYCKYCNGNEMLDQIRFNVLLKESFKCGFPSENASFWNILHLNRIVISYFNDAILKENPRQRDLDKILSDKPNHIRTQPINYWSPNHELSCYIVRLRFNEKFSRWEYVF